MRFSESGNLREHGHGFFWKFAHRRFAGEHHAISAIKNRIGDVGRLRARGQPIRNHGLEHLRRRNHRFPGEIRLRDKLLLCVGDLLDRHFHTEIAARDHDSIRRGKNLVEVRERIGPLNLSNNERMRTHLRRRRAHRLDVGGALDK